MRRRSKATLIGLNFLILLVLTVLTGSGCGKDASNPALLAAAGDKAIALKNILDRQNPQVAIISRVGSNMDEYNLHYTHGAFVVRNYPGREGYWTVIHLLNHAGTKMSSLYAQGLLNFFMDDLYNLDFRVTIPTPDLQQKIIDVLNSPLKLQLHNSNYSLIAYPFSTQYQNSNQWLIEVITTATTGVTTRVSAQRVLQKEKYKPSILNVRLPTKIGAQLFKANVQFDDHPLVERSSSQYSVVTVESLVAYLKDRHKVTFDKEYREAKTSISGLLSEK